MSDSAFSFSLGFAVVAFVGMCLVLVPTAFFFKLAWRRGLTGKFFVGVIAAILTTLLAAFAFSSEYPTDFESNAVAFIFTWGLVIWPTTTLFYFVMAVQTWLRQRGGPRNKASSTGS